MAKYTIPSSLYKNIQTKGDDSMKDICKKILSQNVYDEDDNKQVNAKLALCIKMYERALKGDSRYMTMFVNIVGEMPMTDADKTVIVPMLVNNIPNG